MKTSKKPQSNNVISINHNTKTPTSLEVELVKIEQEIKSYLERVEFYIEEPDSDYIKRLQDKRTNVLVQLETKKLKEKSNVHSNTIEQLKNKISKLEQKLSLMDSTLIGVKSKLEKERELRIKMHTRIQVYRQEIYRHMYETNPNSSNLAWIKDLIDKDSSWGHKAHTIDE